MEQHWDEKALLAEPKRIEALVKPHLAIGDKTEADFDWDEARVWIEWAKNASPEEREGAINSEKFRSLSLKVQESIMEGIEKNQFVDISPKLLMKSIGGLFHQLIQSDEEELTGVEFEKMLSNFLKP